MRYLTFVAVLCLCGSAFAGLQNVEIGGMIEIRGRGHLNTWNSPSFPEVRIPGGLMPGRPIGWFAGGRITPRRIGAVSLFDWDSDGNEWMFLETTTSLDVKADLTDNVSAMMTLYDTHLWGEDFRSNYLTGADMRANTADDVEFLQSYVQVDEAFGLPVRVRIGRQIMQYDRGWLVAAKYSPTQRQAFDAIRLTYAQDDLELNAWWSKLNERSPIEQDGDTDFSGLHASYTGLDYAHLSAYWMWLRDAQSLNDTNFAWPLEWAENVLDIDDYDPTNLHTVGGRVYGGYEGFDYSFDAAYQFGDADSTGFRFKPFVYGDDEAEYDNWATDLELGYTFRDMAWKPRVMLGGAWFEGEDNRDLTFWEWLNPFDKPDASVSFNRLFSGRNYCPAFQDNAWMTNFKHIRGGVSMDFSEKMSLMLRLQSLWVDEGFDWPRYVTLGNYRVFLAPNLSFWTQPSDDHIGYSTCMLWTYRYTEDLTFRIYWGHLFASEGSQDGHYMFFNGTDFMGGTDDEDSDYAFFWITLKF